MNNVSLMQLALAKNLKGGLASLGNRPLEEAQFGLQKSQLQHQMGREQAQDTRQAEMDALQRPGMEVNSQVAKNYQEEAKQPLRASMLMPDVNSVEHWFWTPQDDEKRKGQKADPMITRFASMYGGSWDTKDDSPTRGQLIRPDGTPVTLADAHRNAEPIKAFIAANSGLKHTMQSAKEKLLRSFEKGAVTKPEYDSKLAQINDFETNPAIQLQYARKQIDTLSQFGDSGNPLFNSEVTSGLKRWQGTYDKLYDKVEKNRNKFDERQFETEKMKFDRDTKIMVANIKAGGKPPTQKEIDAQNALKLQHLVGKAKELGMLIQAGEDGVVASLTEKEANRLKALGKTVGMSVYMEATGEERDRPGWFTGDDPLYTVSIVPDTSEKGSKPVQKPVGAVDSFIEKQLGRYPDVAQPEAKPALQPAHEPTIPELAPAPGQEPEGVEKTNFEIDGKQVLKKGKSYLIENSDGTIRELTEVEIKKLADKIRGESKPINVRFGKRAPGTPRP